MIELNEIPAVDEEERDPFDRGFPVLGKVRLPIFSEELATEDAVKAASILVDQAIHGRNMQLELTDGSGRLRRAALHSYFWYTNMRLPRFLVLTLLAILIFFERPPYCFDTESNCFFASDGILLPRSGLPIMDPSLSLALELVCFLLLFFFDPFLKMFFIRPQAWLWKSWDGLKTAIYFLLAIDTIVSYCVTRPWRVSPWGRLVIFCIVTYGARNAVFTSLLVWWSVADIILILGVFLLFFAWIGVVLFSGTPSAGTYFNTYVDSLASLQITLTTANFPDVMLPAYVSSPAAAVFFAAFFLCGLYFLLPLILASIYATFRDRLQAEGVSFRRNRDEMLRAAFSILSRGKPAISEDILFALVANLNRYVAVPYVSTAKRSLLMEFLDKSRDSNLSEEEFKNILTALSSKAIRTSFSSPLVSVFPKWTATRCFSRFEMFVVKYLGYIIDLVVVVDVILLIYETIVLLSEDGRPSPLSPWIQASFVFVYVFEMLLKLVVMSPKGYWSSPLNRFDALVSVASLIVTIIVLVPNAVSDPLLIRVFTLIRVFRLFRILSRLQRFQVLFGAVLRIGAVLVRASLPLLIYYTFFALLGMTLYGGLIYEGNPKLIGTSFQAAGYINCSSWNDGYSSFVTLFQLMIVNNWFIIAEGPEAVTNSWSRVFFVIWWLVSVLVNVNIFVALLLESFSEAQKAVTQEASVLANNDTYHLEPKAWLDLYDVAN